MIAALYVRKSTEQTTVSDEQKSVARQIEHARAYCEGKGWPVADDHVYVDDGISGAEFDRRPAFLRLMNALKPRAPFDVLVMSEESRLGRESIETGYALKRLITAGVRVFFYLEDRERKLDGPMDKMMLSLVTFADEMERERGRQRTYDAMTRKARAGHVTGGRVFGYDNRTVIGPDGQRSHVERVINEAEAAVVRQIFQLCAEGHGMCSVAKGLNDEAALTPRSQRGRPRAWAPSSIRAILYRDLYRGEVVWNKTKKRDSWGQHRQRARPATDWIRIPVADARIVTEQLWIAAHDRLSSTRATYLRAQGGQLWGRPASGLASKYLLTGIARCGVCGAGLEVRSRKHGRSRRFFYSCSSYYRRGRAVCPNRYEIPMDEFDQSVIRTLLDEVLSSEVIDRLTARVPERARETLGQPDAKVIVARQLADAEDGLHRLTTAIARGGDVPALVEAIKFHDSERRTLRARLDVLEGDSGVIDDRMERALVTAVREWREVLTRQVVVARQIVRKLVEGRITVTPETRDGQPGFRFRAIGTLMPLLEGVIPGQVERLRAVASPTAPTPLVCWLRRAA